MYFFGLAIESKNSNANALVVYRNCLLMLITASSIRIGMGVNNKRKALPVCVYSAWKSSQLSAHAFPEFNGARASKPNFTTPQSYLSAIMTKQFKIKNVK
ncbi:MAG: hypothetical protein BRC51_17355 [Cyanobacteria bacterium SW_12_48_29]|nr:MAG: hypothetical protein BRC51_17355 [Cyanobacteria bacterium SW_12_48_29]